MPSQPVDAFQHEDKRRNLPTADARDFVSEEVAAPRILDVRRNTALDPQLVWRGKDQQDEVLRIQAPPIYIQEKIEPRALIEDLRRAAGGAVSDAATLFGDFDGLGEFESVDFYRHDANWANRMILGDSLEVMASLVEREDLREKVQCVYIDPPYGIKFQSNFQGRAGSPTVRDRISDVSREVEQIKAFRDTWEIGIHSYLEYLQHRLRAARDLLADSGSIFVQIGDANVHLVRGLLDEVFGTENFTQSIVIQKTTGAGSPGELKWLPGVTDHVLWYAKNRPSLRYRSLWRPKSVGAAGGSLYTRVLERNGQSRPMTRGERAGGSLPVGARAYGVDNLMSASGVDKTRFPVTLSGRTYTPHPRVWKTSQQGMQRLIWAGRVHAGAGKNLGYIRYLDDFPAFPLVNVWSDVVGQNQFAGEKVYTVQTANKIVERCILMTTDPGDLVLDPTCGSGTTAYVAEQWGRRWITIDTSRVALALARQRLMAARHPYYLLADSPEGQKKEADVSQQARQSTPTSHDVRKGFVYERLPHVTLKSIANNPEIREGMTREEIDRAIAKYAEVETLYDRPYEDSKRVRVSGRFTVESLSPHRTISVDAARGRGAQDPDPILSDSPGYERSILENLRAAGVQNGRTAERLNFDDVEFFPGRFLQAVGTRADATEGTPQRIGIAIGPEYGTVNAQFIKAAAREALRGLGVDSLLILGFSFDAQASEVVGEFRPDNSSDYAAVVAERVLGRLPVVLVRMNADLAMGDELLKKTGAGNLFTIFGEPDVEVESIGEEVVVEIKGVDVYDPTTGQTRSSDAESIALWMLDTDYNGESFFVRHAYFGGKDDPYSRLRRALRAEINESAWEALNSTRSRPFPRPSTGRVAIKAINDYGDEVLVVREVP